MVTPPPPASASLKTRLLRALRLRCPLCGETPLFRSFWHMSETCAACHYHYEREGGYWLGAMYINYVVTAAFGFAAHILMSTWNLRMETQLIAIVPYVIAFPLIFARYARAFWIAVDVTLDQPREKEYHRS